MRLCLAPTDTEWFEYHASHLPDEVNFWRPGMAPLRGLQPGELFLFNRKAPYNHIAGGGIFVRFTQLPLSLAWLAFETKNGVQSASQLRQKILTYRTTDEADPIIGCIVLTSPFFLPQALWIPTGPYIGHRLQGPEYISLETPLGRDLWEKLQERVEAGPAEVQANHTSQEIQRCGQPHLVAPRLGQGAFRVLVTDAYQRRCSATGEKTLPVLEAAHIRPYSEEGPHSTTNGLLLRSDLHILFDRGFITVTPEHRIEVSPRLEKDFGNGKIYYALHGQELKVLPTAPGDKPAQSFLEWHNDNVYQP